MSPFAEGIELIVLPVDRLGRVVVEAARAAINDKTLLVSVQAANNEIGTLQPIAEITQIAHRHGAIVHCDAAQAVGKFPINLAGDAWQVDLLLLAHTNYTALRALGCYLCVTSCVLHRCNLCTTGAKAQRTDCVQERPMFRQSLALAKPTIFLRRRNERRWRPSCPIPRPARKHSVAGYSPTCKSMDTWQCGSPIQVV